LHNEFVHFAERRSRSEYVARRFAKYLRESVLDVGCFEAPLRDILRDVDYTGVDMTGNPDIQLHLERCESLPFESDSFHCVICLEVLEHLDNLHAMFDEIIRVARTHVILSLPNCWRGARRPVERGKGSFGHYGLPVQAPADRHKWFINYVQARDFFTGQAEEKGLTITELFTTEKRRPLAKILLRHLLFRGDRYRNRYVETVWCVYSK
jgi:SAM-dependent methyltransferase